MTDNPESELPILPVRRPGPMQVSAEYAQWTAECPVKRVQLRNGQSAVVVTRYAESKAILSDPRTSADRSDPRFPNFRKGIFSSGENTNIRFMDGELHQKYRRMLAPEFTPKRLAAMKPQLESFVKDSVDRLLAAPQPADFHAMFSRPVPSQMICVLLGIDYEKHHEVFENATQRILNTNSPAEEFSAAFSEVEQLMRNVVHEQITEPGTGVIGRLVTRYLREGALSEEQLVGFANLLLVGGHETTATMITWTVFNLLTEPGLADAIRKNPALLPGAVEEILRVHAITDITMEKLALEDIEVDGYTVRAGEGIIPLGLAANFDPRIYEDASTLNPERAEERHLTFGAGIHSCIGQNLARMELEIVCDAVVNRIPGLRLAIDPNDLECTHDSIVWALKKLPVEWDES